jgi:hypothetical protein
MEYISVEGFFLFKQSEEYNIMHLLIIILLAVLISVANSIRKELKQRNGGKS